jgi:hypothetical protein
MKVVAKKTGDGTIFAFSYTGANAPGPGTISEDGIDKEQPK